jgi:RNA recognition motif-containing protein
MHYTETIAYNHKQLLKYDLIFSFSAAEDRKLFIGGLSWETREPQLKEYFEKFGEVESVNLKMNPMTGKSRCFAFVVFKTAADVVSVQK